MALTWAELERVAHALLDAYRTPAALSQMMRVELRLELGHEVSLTAGLRDVVFELLRRAHRERWLTALLEGALAGSANPRLAAELHPLLAKLNGEPAAGARVEVPDLPPGPRGRGLLLIAAREHAEQLLDLENALGALQGADAPTIVGRRYVDPGALPAAPHERLEQADVAVVLIGRDLATSRYLWDVEAGALRDRHDRRRLVLVPVVLGSFIHTESRLAGLPVIDGVAGGVPLGADALAARIGQVIAGTATTGSGATTAAAGSLSSYALALRARLVALDGDVAGFVEPTKVVVEPPSRRRRARPDPGVTSRASLTKLLEDHREPRAVALLGEPGSGKSLLLRQLAGHHLATLAQGDDRRRPVPVYIKLAAYTACADGRPVPFVEFLHHALANGPPGERPLVRELDLLLGESRLLVLLDGMDEMPRADFPQRVARLAEFLGQYRGRVVVACRERDFEREPLAVLQIRLRPFSDDEIAAHLTTAVPLGARAAADDVQALTRADHPLAPVVRNPLSLGLIARARALEGVYPLTTSELFRGHVARALDPARTRRDAAELRAGLAMVAFEMAEVASPGATVAFDDVMVRMLGKLAAPDQLIDAGVAAGLVRRDDATGDLGFVHARIQELLIAAHLLRLAPEVQRPWLEAHADEPWFDEVYVLAARDGLDCTGLIAWVVGEADALLARPGERSLARDAELVPHERRLTLLGRLADSVALPAEVVAPAARILARLWHDDRLVAVGRTRLAVLRAARAAMLAHEPLHAVVVAGARSRQAAWRREAWRALASDDDLATVRRTVVRQAVTTNYLHHAPGDLGLAGAEPRLARLQRWSSLTMGLHLGLLLVSALWLGALVAAPVGPPEHRWLQVGVAAAVLVFHAVGISRSQDGDPSTLRHLLLSVVAALAAAPAVVLPAVLVRGVQALGGADAAPAAVLAREQVMVLAIALVVGATALYAGLFRVGRRLLDDGWSAILAGAVGGLVVSIWRQTAYTLPPWSVTVTVAVVWLVVIALLAPKVRAAVSWLRRSRRWRKALPIVGALALVWLAIIGVDRGCAAVAPRVHARLESGGVYLVLVALGVLAAFGVYGAIRNNLRALLTLGRGTPCDVAEAARHLEGLASDVLLGVARRRTVARLQGMTPRSRVVELALTARAGHPRWVTDGALAVALRELGRRRARAGADDRAGTGDELTVLVAVAAADRAAVAAQWLAELSAAERAAIRERATGERAFLIAILDGEEPAP